MIKLLIKVIGLWALSYIMAVTYLEIMNFLESLPTETNFEIINAFFVGIFLFFWTFAMFAPAIYSFKVMSEGFDHASR